MSLQLSCFQQRLVDFASLVNYLTLPDLQRRSLLLILLLSGQPHKYSHSAFLTMLKFCLDTFVIRYKFCLDIDLLQDR
ncbi:MAG: hypothetical protein GPOALKHO_001092 [Sodalis sp.]|nr:MAG: hypothetical protein GPOALKHO_001092 [Sodalis sp.]